MRLYGRQRARRLGLGPKMKSVCVSSGGSIGRTVLRYVRAIWTGPPELLSNSAWDDPLVNTAGAQKTWRADRFRSRIGSQSRTG